MNVVVNFLSTLVSEESNGSIKRMLGLCAEFERIAKVVLDKAEKDSHARKKRKATSPYTNGSAETNGQDTRQPKSAERDSAPPYPPFSSSSFARQAPAETSPFADKSFANEASVSGTLGVPDDYNNGVPNMPSMSQDFQDMLNPGQMNGMGFPDQSFRPMSPNTGPFQQQFVPQDLWQMPMTIEWDWADMSMNFPGFEGSGADAMPPP